jgi:hypothetical protein
VNGAVTSGGLVSGARISGGAMLAASALGNLLGIVLLVATRRVKVGHQSVPAFYAEGLPYVLSVLLSVIYGRADFVIIARLGISLEHVAIYGLFLRIFDTLTLIRGSLAQQESRDIARFNGIQRVMRLAEWSVKVQRFVGLGALCGVLALPAVWHVVAPHLAHRALHESEIIALLIGIPLFVSHMPTSAAIFADRRSERLLVGSVVTMVLSIIIKCVFISVFGIAGAIFSLTLVEYASCVVFVGLYLSKPFAHGALVRLLGLPLLGALILGVVSKAVT